MEEKTLVLLFPEAKIMKKKSSKKKTPQSLVKKPLRGIIEALKKKGMSEEFCSGYVLALQDVFIEQKASFEARFILEEYLEMIDADEPNRMSVLKQSAIDWAKAFLSTKKSKTQPKIQS